MYEAGSSRSLGGAFLRVVTIALVLVVLIGGSSVLVWTVAPSSARFGFHGQLVDAGPSPTLAPGETTAYTVRFRNVGFVPWQRAGEKQVTLGISDSAMAAVDPRVADHWLSPSRVVATAEDLVLPGMIGTFNFNVRAPAAPGTYRVPMGLSVDSLSWFEDSPFTLVVTSDLGFHSHIVDQSIHPTLIPGALSAPLTVRFRNTGAKAWLRGVAGQQANLGVAADDTSAKALAFGWPTADRVAIQTEPRVAPGGIATFTFRLRAPPTPGTYPLRLRPVVDGLMWLEDDNVVTLVNVVPFATAGASAADPTTAPLKPAGTPTFTVSGAVDRATLAVADSVTATGTFTSNIGTDAVVGIEIYAPGGASLVYQKWLHNENFDASVSRSYPFVWQIPVDATSGTYAVNFSAYSSGWKTLFGAKPLAASFSVAAPGLTAGGASATPNVAPPPPSNAATATPVVPTPGATSPASSATPLSSPTVAPTVPPTATPTAVPTAAPTAAPTPTPTQAPTFNQATTATPSSLAAGNAVSVTASVTSATATTVLVDVEIYQPGAVTPTYQVWFDNQTFAAGQQRSYPATWQVPATAPTGTYVVKIGVFSPGWVTLYSWKDPAAVFAVTAAAPVPTATPTPTPAATLTPAPTGTPTPAPVPTPAPSAPAGLSTLRVQGNLLVDAAGQPLQIRGVNYAGAAFACIQGWGTFGGPTDTAMVLAIKSWRANAVRIPLNEDCWLAINGSPAAYSGTVYRQAVTSYVNLLNANGIYAILDLHWNAPGTLQATSQQPMPDMDHSVTFWSQIATTFKGNDRVIFEPYNEPYPDGNRDTVAAWTCWRDGGTCSGVSFQAAGMQTLVSAIRATGATNVIALGGVEYSNALGRWLAYKPADPLNNLVAAWHVYNFNLCSNVTCYDNTVGVVAAQVPVIATEIGVDNCDANQLNTVMNWLDAHRAGYSAWAWDTWGAGCSSIALILDYAGTPTTYGQIYKTHLGLLP